MNKIAFTSDQHYGHKNILRLCNRPFDNIYHHNEALIANHNSIVYDDTWDVYLLGDTSYRCSGRDTVNILKRLNGKLHILFGNHDKPLRQSWKRGDLDSLIKSGKIELIGSQDRTQIVAKLLKVDGRLLVLSHYAYRTWVGAFRGSIHLYGHSHNNLKPLFKSFDVGVDANNFFPIIIDKVFDIADSIDDNFSEK